jgi:hypothetical protein
MSPEVKGKSPLPKRLQPPLRPSPHRTTSQISSISVEANLTDSEPAGRALLSKDSKYTRQRTLSHPNTKQDSSTCLPEQGSTPKSSPAPVVQRTLSAPGTPGRGHASISPASGGTTSATPSVYSLAVPSVNAPSGSGSSSPSRKGKERALEAVEVEGVDVEGELVAGHEGDATKGLRELVRRTTITEAGGVSWKKGGRSRASTLQGKSSVVSVGR